MYAGLNLIKACLTFVPKTARMAEVVKRNKE
ncbi:hypothetical protein CbuK_1331 [Coxiella burnetii CbuK_Q154]|uniref:Uncharacterized protein n=1 Tax=Coxiella burnetii (strain Dugway 5J108-111) TaxID=434922 RepID=B5XHG3_COXBN|nr:hypothetical protein CBUD_1553a [Coxiella burnetii Dugway 5J108-111]ACJ20508.1 hypothetical protein CbuK_1331 [Coxiella burnetii CbuK_Q154]AIT63579.1 hypothetical protein CBNA_1331 [Coxiella burnetii str. Namibia]